MHALRPTCTIAVQEEPLLSKLIVLLVAFLQAPPSGQWGVDLTGHPVERLAPSGTRAVVLFFTATDCPIANRYIPQMKEMVEHHPEIAVWFVYPNPGDSADAVQAHRMRFGISANVVLDRDHALTRLVHATVTPEAAVLVPDEKGLHEVYRGRIDDRYAGLGRERPRAMHHDLEDVLDAVLAGRPVPRPGGPPVGCAIMPLAGASSIR